MKDVEFNINHKVKVKLTKMGEDIFYHQFDELNKKYHKVVIEPYYPELDENGYVEFQLHELMSLYGQYLHMGGSVENNTLPFSPNILISQLRYVK